MAAECRNPECRKGYTPGVVTSGKGSANAPLVGATMRWGWVKCRACNSDKDHPYQHVPRAPAEIQERARLADAKAPYVNQAPADRSKLEAIKSNVLSPAPSTNGSSNAMVEKLLGQIEKLTDQVSELLTENRALRKSLESKDEASEKPIKRVVVKRKGGSNEQPGSKGKRTLS